MPNRLFHIEYSTDTYVRNDFMNCIGSYIHFWFNLAINKIKLQGL